MRLTSCSRFALSAMLALGGCVSAPAPQPAPPVAVPLPAPSPMPAPPPPPSSDWRDWALTPGNWTYREDSRGSVALFGRVGADAELTLRCDTGRGRIYLSRRGEGAGSLTVRTTSLVRQLSVQPVGTTPPYLAAELGVRDSVLDAIGFSRGRFVVEASGLPTAVVPAWAEILRVLEDCRSQ